MNKKRKRRKLADLVGRIGPATNLRPAGAHDDRKVYDRKKNKAVLEAEDGFIVSGYSIAERFFNPNLIRGSGSRPMKRE